MLRGRPGRRKNRLRRSRPAGEAVSAALSDYHDASELNRLCDRYAVGVPEPVSDDLFRVLRAARGFSEASGGAFDVTVGPVVKLWRRTRRTRELPDPTELAAARERVGWEAVTLDKDARTVTFARPGVRLDLGGIAKGYAADAALAALRERGITRALVDAGGDLVAGDPPPGEDGWTVAVGDGGETLSLANAAVATSGDAYKFTEVGGVRYSHIVDPRTGLGLTDRSTVTVIAADGVTADAWASAVSVLGPDAGLALVQSDRGGKVETRIVLFNDDVRESNNWPWVRPPR